MNGLVYPLPDGRCPVLSMDLDETCAGLDAAAPGDGDGWRRLYGTWERIGGPLLDALMTPFPPVRAGARLAAKLGPAGLWGWSPSQYTIPNDFREVCWSPSTVSANNSKQGAYIETSKTRWTQNGIPKGPPACPIPSG